jgi:hypothetical protein
MEDGTGLAPTYSDHVPVTVVQALEAPMQISLAAEV